MHVHVRLRVACEIIAFLSVTDTYIHTYIETISKMRCRIICLALRCLAIKTLRKEFFLVVYVDACYYVCVLVLFTYLCCCAGNHNTSCCWGTSCGNCLSDWSTGGSESSTQSPSHTAPDEHTYDNGAYDKEQNEEEHRETNGQSHVHCRTQKNLHIHLLFANIDTEN